MIRKSVVDTTSVCGVCGVRGAWRGHLLRRCRRECAAGGVRRAPARLPPTSRHRDLERGPGRIATDSDHRSFITKL